MKLTATLIGLIFSLSLFAQANKQGLVISHLTGNFYVYTTYTLLDGKPFPSNSMYLITDKGAVMFDTPWDTTQFQPLLDSIKTRHKTNVVLCIATHFHADRTGGFDFLRQKGIKTFSSKLTYDLCKARNEKQAAAYFTKDTTFIIGNYSFRTYYPGEGHTKDNIVIWFNHEKILYGGCLVKSTENNSLGNIADANLSAWPATMKKLMKQFPQTRYVIPGHFDWTNNNSLEHTLKLLQENTTKNEH
jgi:metallo-beta-lactamase class B